MMKFTQGEIAKVYGYIWEQTNEGQKEYLRAKMDRLNNIGNIEDFYGQLDLTNQQNFKQVVSKKLGFMGGLK